MKNKSAIPAKSFQFTGAMLGCFALVAQLYFMLNNGFASAPDTVLHFFSYFTILTNILAAVCFIILFLRPGTRFFSSSSVLTAITVYISVVGLIYNIILRAIWSPHGFESLVNELLHSVIPVLFIVYWFAFVPKQNIIWKNMAPGLIYPALYCVWALLLGHETGWYPYPFLDVLKLGWQQTIINISGMIMVFVLVFILFTGIAKLIVKLNR